MVAPKLRFKEFAGNWPSVPLKDFVSFRKGKGISKADIQEDGIFQCIRYGELYTTYGQVITTIKSRTNISPSESILSQNGDVIIPASGETQIDIATASCVAKENVILGGDLNILSHQESGEWLAYYLSSAKKLEIAQLAQGNSVVHLYSSQLKELKVNKPTKEEQTKIATFLSAVDEKIAQLSQKLHLLDHYKQGMVQKLLNQKIRFKADDGSEFDHWKKTKLDDLLIKHEEKADRNYQYPVLTSSRNGMFFQKDYFAGQDVASSDTTGYNVVPFGYFTYRHMSDDLVFKFNINTLCEKGIVSTLYPVFTVKETHLNKYFLQIILNEGNEFRNFAIMQKQGGSRTYMYYSKLKELILNIPTLPEQTKIANFLSALDQKINVVSDQLEQAKLWKKGLLQQMFV